MVPFEKAVCGSLCYYIIEVGHLGNMGSKIEHPSQILGNPRESTDITDFFATFGLPLD